MKILILCESFPPEINSISSLYGELVTELSNQGHEVRVVTRTPRTYIAEQDSSQPAIDSLSGVTVKRIRILPTKRSFIPIRILEQFSTSGRMFLEGLRGFKPEVILVYSPPLPYVLPAILLHWIRRSAIVLNVQDLYPQTAIDLGYLKNGIFKKLARLLETLAYKNAARVIVHSEGNKSYVVSRGVSDSKISAIPNWIDTEKITPTDKNNEFRQQHGLNGKFVVSFAGVMGLAQGLGIVLESAEALRSEKNLIFLLIGDGAMKLEYEKRVSERQLTNVKLLSMQPPEVYPQILAASDLCLVTLDKRLKTPVVPGKLQAIMASGRPVLASVASEGDVPVIIRNAQCGMVVDAGDSGEMTSAIQTMMADQNELSNMGNRGRSYAEQHFAKSTVLVKFTQKLLNPESPT